MAHAAGDWFKRRLDSVALAVERISPSSSSPPGTSHSYPPRLYRRLGHHDFRVLELFPGPGLRAKIRVVNLKKSPKYLALSYTWGPSHSSQRDDASQNCFVLVDDAKLPIRKNLYDAMNHMLEAILHKNCPVFIDALCINQDNVKERSAQVQIMRKIYERSSEVWAWLGVPESDDDARIAVETLHRISSVFTSLGPYATDAQVDGELVGVFELSDDEMANRWTLLARLLAEQEYWRRTWILQEVTGPARTVFWFGQYLFNRDELVGMLTLMEEFVERTAMPNGALGAFGSSHAPNRLMSYYNIRRMNAFGSRSKEEGLFDLYTLCNLSRQTRCSDPRDKVFAAAGLTSTNSSALVRPDYTKSAQQVYMDAAKLLVVRDESVTILRYVGHQASGPSTFVPTWVPDWRSEPADIVRPLAQMNACNSIFKPVPSVLGSCLEVYGKIVDQINYVATVPRPVNPKSFGKFEPLEPQKIYNHTGQTMIDAYMTTLVADYSAVSSSLGYWEYHRGAQLDWSIYGPCDTQEDVSRRTRLTSTAEIACSNRTYGTTAREYMGMIPIASIPGDTVVVLATGYSAYVLRHKSGDRYAFVGECYIHGIMDGEAMGDGQGLQKFVLE